VAYPAKAGFDQATGIGSVNVANLIGKWNTAFTSGTTLTATPQSIATTASTTLKATVTGGTPTGYTGTAPALTGTATFKAGTTVVGSCTLSGGICSKSVAGSSFPVQNGANSVTATFSGSGTYPASTSSAETVTVTGGGGNPAATMTSPTQGSTLTGISVPFTWTSETNATKYYLSIGSTGVGSTNVYNSGWRTVTTWTAVPLPTNGEMLYVRLSTDYSGTVVYNDYTYTASKQAAITSPTSSILPGANVTFDWSAATGATKYYLSVGSTGVGSTNVYNSGWRDVTSWEATGLPINGETLYVRLTTDYSGLVAYSNTTYLAATAAVLTTPAPGTTLSGSSVTFDWSAATGAPTQYYLSIGSTGVGSSNIYNSGWRDVTSWTAVGLPTNGETLYVRLSTDYGGTAVHNDYTYKAH
jgi:hypothetical protein